MITKLQKEALLLRAEYSCEYCRTSLLGSEYQIDHIAPVSKGGTSALHNLAISCPRCNKNKGNLKCWNDPITGRPCNIFNPTTMKWTDHFWVVSNEVVGKSETGRATAALLFRRTEHYLPVDLRWSKLQHIERNKCLYGYFNNLRYRRLTNDFSTLDKLLRLSIPEVYNSEIELAAAMRARDLLLLELYFTRSKFRDIDNGIRHANKVIALNQHDRNFCSEVYSMLSILHQQKSTFLFNLGATKDAVYNQKHASIYFVKSRLGISGSTSESMISNLREQTLQSKYRCLSINAQTMNKYISGLSDIDPFQNSAIFSYVIDMELARWPVSHKNFERLYILTTAFLEAYGYGSIVDYAKLITVRRRWWVLHMILEFPPNLDCLRSDVIYWKSVDMNNEIRELLSSVVRFSALIPHAAMIMKVLQVE